MPDLFLSPMGSVQLSQDLIRISRMPRRFWTPEDVDHAVEELTDILRTPVGTMRLKPVQAMALMEIGTARGLFGAMGVGAGKTLVSFLAPVVSFSERPILLIPAKLYEKTKRDYHDLSIHWRLPKYIRIVTYDWLGRHQAADALEKFMPDIIVADECHKLRNLKAAVSRRVRRFLTEHQHVRFVSMSGTSTKRSLHDYAHLMRMVYSPDLDRMPLPQHWTDLESWADALDNRKDQTKRADPGALKILCNDDEQLIWDNNPTKAARLAYQRRLRDTEGFVATDESSCDATLTVSSVQYDPGPQVNAAFEKLRRDWELPDDWTLNDGLQVAQHARQLALGFYYKWDPRPPAPWLEARKAWSKFCRDVLKHSRKYDSERQVKMAFPDVPELVAWRAIEKNFVPNTVPVWLSDTVLRSCADWANRNSGIVWTEHVVFGEMLERDFGIKYYGRGGDSADKTRIDDHPADRSLVASIRSSSEGRNLQKWNTSLVTCWPANGIGAEQILGRTHREGQEADEVQVDVVLSCLEHATSFWQSVADARYAVDTTGAQQKILLAGKNFPSLDAVLSWHGHRWGGEKEKEREQEE